MTATENTYLDPAINLETAHYWEAAKEGRLLLKRCNDCDQVHYYPRAVCPHCLSSATGWIQACGRGRIYSYSVMRRVPIPYAIAYIALDEGVTMMSNLVECDFDALQIDQPVEVVFRATENGERLPMFRPMTTMEPTP
jgi:uncharacterized OB-fold protein